MDALLKYIVNGYNYLFYELASPRTRDWALVAKPYQLACIIFLYRYFCTRLGPQFMKHRNPFNISKVMIIYNIIQIFLSIHLVLECTNYVFFHNYSYTCQGLELDDDIATMVASGVWTYYISKLSELLDTVFFVLRKSNRQITSLHLHHHTLMPIITWYSVTYIPGGQVVLVGYLNTIVHTVMYTYYLIAGLGDNFKKHIWWKKYVTILQLIQFLLLGLQNTVSLFYTCDYMPVLKVLAIFYSIFFLRTFGQFYYDSYIKESKQMNKEANGTRTDTKSK